MIELCLYNIPFLCCIYSRVLYPSLDGFDWNKKYGYDKVNIFVEKFTKP